MNTLRGLMLLVVVMLGGAFAQDAGDWFITRKVDIFTDENSSYATVFPTEHPTGGASDVLVVTCFKHDLAPLGVLIAASSSSPIVGSDVEVLYRVDDREAVTRSWWSNGAGVGPVAPPLVLELVGGLLGGERLALRYSALGGSRTYVYPVSGFRAALAQLGCYTGEH